ncbi:uncharacterized protein PITG_00418 [Phytophthora infestans T30-4]|uniref:Ribosome assembly protein 3 n=2 Tax=Phytophthora infestans TaxID=4787 RepID=D0MQR6_PHYIT|nr:uncharacterized protein PITG_00418 [Phytophthora infestans T30-4]EEY57835.1 conserved hypothetical protein [Phytophthora infestans T30-4]KAF4033358.1 Ribosome-assembly protein 3 [Phytophthora infestans]|eukprot:XP_002909021.1 conserved hypothetical protein [Phytophthora infestans T30-4]
MDGKAAQLVARYDRLIAALGEDAFKPSSGVCARVEDASAAVAEVENDEQRQKLLNEATDKCMRCADLIAKSLEASATLAKLQKTLKNAYDNSQNGHNDEDEDMESEEDEQYDTSTTLLLQDLVAAGDEAEDAAKKYARLGVVRKTARASHELLASAEHDLNEHLASESTTPGDAVMQNEFQQLYMDEFTTAFGDELDQFRQEERFESKDVTYLISCIHAGGDIFTPLQKKLFVEASRTTE